jgi:hypothetical protein
MAKPTTASWSKLLIMLGDGATPTETFAAPCALTTKGISFTADTSDSNVPDCDDPDLPSWVERVPRGFSAEISGGGRLALGADNLGKWVTWWESGAAKNIRVKLDVPLADNGGHWAGRFVLTAFGISGNEDDGKIGIEVTMQSDGEVVWVDASA